jgi:hypothetical protein
MDYDRNNVFARILRGELPCNKVFEEPHFHFHLFAGRDLGGMLPRR